MGDDEPEAKGTLMLGELGHGKHKRRIVYEQPEVKDINPLKVELELFVTAVRGGARPVVGAEDGMRALEVAQTILEKINEHTMVM